MLLELLVACGQEIKEDDISDTGECIDEEPVMGLPISTEEGARVDYYTINKDRSAQLLAWFESAQLDSCSLSEDTTSYLNDELHSGRIAIWSISLCSTDSNPLYIGLAEGASLALFCSEPSWMEIDCAPLAMAWAEHDSTEDVTYERCFQVACGSSVYEVTGYLPNDPQEDCPDDTGV